MPYVNDDQSIRRQAEMLETLNRAYARSSGYLRITLANGQSVRGRYYGAQCTANSASKLCCSVSLGNEDPGVYDFLDIRNVEAVE